MSPKDFKGPQKSDWRKAKAAPTTAIQYRRPKSDYTRFLILGAAAMCAVSALIYFIILALAVPVPTPLIGIAADYREDFPPNGYAWEDMRQLEQIATTAVVPRVTKLDAQASLVTRLGELLRGSTAAPPELRTPIVPGGPARTRIMGQGGVVLIYLSAHAAVNRSGEPCFLLAAEGNGPGSGPAGDTGRANADPSAARIPLDPFDCGTWLTAKELLDRIQKLVPDPQVKKVILLDTGKLPTAWRIGVVINEFHDRLAELVQDNPNLTILLACGNASEQAWVAPELSNSVFGYFASRGLQGAANENRDGKITLHEFYRYVRDQVQHYVHTNYGANQVPRLLPPLDPSRDFPLTYAPDQVLEPVTSVGGVKSLVELAAPWKGLWERFRNLSQRSVPPLHVTQPVAYTELHAILLQAEENLLAGEQYREALQGLRSRAEDLLARLEGAADNWQSVTPGFPAFIAKLDESTRLAAEKSWSAWQKQQAAQPAGAKPEGALGASTAKEPTSSSASSPESAPPTDAPQSADGTKPAEAPAGAAPTNATPAASKVRLPLAALVQVVWADLAQRTDVAVNATRVGDGLQFVQQMRDPQDREDPPELALLKLVHSYYEWSLANSHTSLSDDLLHALLQAYPLAMRANFPDDPRVANVGKTQRQQLDQTLRRAIDLLIVASPTACLEAKQVCLQLQDPAVGYPRIHTWHKQMAAVNEIYDRWTMALPRVGEWMIRSDSAPHARLGELVPQLERLGQELTRLTTVNAEQPAEDGDTLALRIQRLHEDALRVDQELWECIEATPLRNPAEWRHRLSLGLDRSQGQERILAGYFDSLMTLTRPADSLPEKIATLDAVPPRDRRWQAIDPRREWTTNLPRLGKASSTDMSSTPSWEVGGRMRDRLASTEQRFQEQRRQLDESLQGEAARHLLQQQASDMRAELTLQGDRRRDGEWFQRGVYDPSALQRDYAIAELLVQQGLRSAEDAWGAVTWPDWDPPPVKYPEDVTTSYFSRSCLRLQVAIQSVLDRMPNVANRSLFSSRAVVERLTKPMTDLVAQRQKELADWTSPSRLSDGNVSFVPPYVNSALATLWHAADHRHSGLALPCDKPQMESVKVASNLSGVVTLWRGHVRPVEKSNPWVVQWRAPTNHARINVLPDDTTAVSVMFVLDCSGSMGIKLGPDTRMQQAKQALQDTVRDLERMGGSSRVATDRLRLGLMAYGFRTKWTKDATGKDVVGFSAVQREFFPESNVSMEQDVETLVSIRPIHEVAEDVDRWVGRMRPSGATPLYLSMRLALEQRPTHLVVVTDGENNPSGMAAKPTPDNDKDLVRARESAIAQGTFVHVILFGEPAAKSQLESELQIQKNPRMKVYHAGDRAALMDILNVSLDMMKYQTGTGEPVPLSTPTTVVVDKPASPQNLDLKLLRPALQNGMTTVLKQPLVVEGDEDLLFRIHNSPDSSPELEPYDDASSLPMSQEASGFRLGLTRDLRGNAAHFSVAMSDSNVFTKRPAQIWAEIAPEGGSPRYTFLDRSFQPNTHRPVLQFAVNPWHGELERATVRFWFRTTAASPEKVAPWAGLRVTLHGITLSAIPQTSGSRQCIIEEKHASADTMGTMRVDLQPPAASVERRWYYDESPPRVRHVFTVDEQTDLKTVKVQMTSLELFRRGAVEVVWPRP